MMRILFLLGLVTALNQHCVGQSFYMVEGRIVDVTTSESIPFASIAIKGSSSGTTSNADGVFLLRVPSSIQSSFTITVSSIGYESAEIQTPSSQITISLRPSTIRLKEVLVVSKDLRPEKIVNRAFRSIRKNYNTNPFLYKSFYRHYCKDNQVYGRLIEGAVDIYKTKGYKTQQNKPGERDEVRVVQLRRSYDNTKMKDTHRAIALYSVMGVDQVGYQVKSAGGAFDFLREVSPLRRRMNAFQFSLEGITQYEGQEVYMVYYRMKKDSIFLRNGFPLHVHHFGTLYINTKDYAIVKSEWNRYSSIDTIQSVSIYKKFSDKYYLQYAMKDARAHSVVQNYSHDYHLELMTSEIITENFEKFKGKEPDQDGLLKIDYDSSFWNSYNILKATPLEESIASDLQRERPLEDQYKEFPAKERARAIGGTEDENEFNAYLTKMRDVRPVYIDLWASWCGPCIGEMYFSKALFEKYKSKISFVYVSIDHNIEKWKDMIERLDLERPEMKHFRVGPQGVVLKAFDVASIPRYILVDKNGNFVKLNAPRPSDPELIKEFERLLAE